MTLLDSVQDAPARVVIPYVPRKHFIAPHASNKRWTYLVAHRRSGKSVFLVNHIGRAALQNQRKNPPPRYAYVGPSFAQAKDLVWGYIKQFFGSIPGISFSESELTVTFPNGALFSLYGGSSAYERMRGIYLDGVAMDEFALLHPSAFPSVIRPALTDYRGWAIISGTSNGADHFYEAKKTAEKNPDEWDMFDIKVYETDALLPDEIEETRLQISASTFAREFLNSFESPVEGSFYEEQFIFLEKHHRITTGVPWDPRFPVFTCWDLGISDHMAIWWIQRAGREVHVLDYYENKGKGLDFYCKVLANKPYQYSHHVVPHDARARELGTGVSREEIMNGLLDPLTVTICPTHTVADGIEAVRSLLPQCWFDKKQTEEGVAALKAYQVSKSMTHDTNIKPLHNWASHGSDAFRHGAVAMDMLSGWGGTMYHGWTGALKRKIKGII